VHKQTNTDWYQNPIQWIETTLDQPHQSRTSAKSKAQAQTLINSNKRSPQSHIKSRIPHPSAHQQSTSTRTRTRMRTTTRTTNDLKSGSTTRGNESRLDSSFTFDLYMQAVPTPNTQYPIQIEWNQIRIEIQGHPIQMLWTWIQANGKESKRRKRKKKTTR